MSTETRILRYDVLSSTNSESRRLIESGEIAGPVCITARRQTGGRGRGDRAWHSPAGGLWMTQVLVPVAPRERWSLYPLMAGVAVARAVRETFGLECDLKWPNDLWWSGRKLGGILCETVGEYILAGIGVNVQVDLGEMDSVTDPRPVDLAEACGTPFCDGQHEVQLLLRAVQRNLDLEHSVLAECPRRLLQRYRRLCVLIGERVRVITGGDEYVGVACGVEEDGALTVLRMDGSYTGVRAGDVSLRLESGGEDR